MDCEHGFLLSPSEPGRWAAAVARLLDDPSLRARMGRAGRTRVEGRFSLAAYVEAMVGAYEHAREPAPVTRAGVTR